MRRVVSWRVYRAESVGSQVSYMHEVIKNFLIGCCTHSQTKQTKWTNRTRNACPSFPHTFHMHNMPKHTSIYTAEILEYESDVADAAIRDQCEIRWLMSIWRTEYDCQPDDVRVFARKSTRNQMKIDSPDDRSTILHDYTRLPRLSALANRMSTADGQSVPPSLCFSTLNFALWECLTPFRGNSGTLNLASTLFIRYHSMENVSPKLIMRICCDIWQRTAFSYE